MHGGALDFWLLAIAAALLIVLWRRQGWLHPTTLFAVLWTVALGLRITAPMLQATMTDTAAVIIGVGLLAVSAPAVFGSRPLPTPDDMELGQRAVALWRLIVLTTAATAAVAIGVYAFRSQISAAAGANFAELTDTAIRRAQNNAARGGPLTLLMSLAPLLGALGIYGGLRYSRWWYLATIVALVAVLQSPARTTSLGLVATCATFYAYARPILRRDPEAPQRKQRSGRAVALQFVVAAGAGLGYFVYSNNNLGKDTLALSSIIGWTWPGWLAAPVQYLVGGVSGLAAAVALPKGFQNPFTDTGQSVYLFYRLVGQSPNTVANYTDAPFPINVYTGFGNMYFDFGLLGVVVLSLILGMFAQRAYRSSRLRLENAWVAAVLVDVLVSTVLVYRLFALDVVTVLACGWLAFWWLRRSEKWRPTATSARPRTSSPGQRTPTG